MKIGLREANQKFSQIIRAVKAGKEILLTERGKPLAVIRAVRGAKDERSTLEHLEAAGLLRRASHNTPLPPWPPRPIRGPNTTDTLRQERDRD